ncbi:hypothetical protein GGI43DRAFT_425900 [Trichoderma evansii]
MASAKTSFSSASLLPSDTEFTYERPSRRQDFHIAIICALLLEYDAAILLVDEFWDQDGRQYGRTSGDTNVYRNGRIGAHNVVLMLLLNMGKATVAGSAANLWTSYQNLKLVLLVGVCGGVPTLGSHEALLGDVVIGETIVQYDFGRRYPGELIPKEATETSLGAPNKNIRSLLAYFKTNAGRDDLRRNTANNLMALQRAALARSYHQDEYHYPGPIEDKLFAAAYRHKHRERVCDFCQDESDRFCDEAAQASCAELGCDEDRLIPRQRLFMKRDLKREEAQRPNIFVGRIASADTMEGAGLWDEAPCIVVKGICDYADSHKNKIWQPFAAATAAAAAKAMLGQYDLADNPRPLLHVISTGEMKSFVGFITPAQLKKIMHSKLEKSSSVSALVHLKGSPALRDAIFDFQSSLNDNQRQELQDIIAIPDADAVLILTAQLDSLNRNRQGCSIASRLHSVLQSVRDFSAESFEQEFKRDVEDIKRYSTDVNTTLYAGKAQADHRNQRLQSEKREEASKERRLRNLFSRNQGKFSKVEAWQLQSDERQAKERQQQLLDSLSKHDYLTLLKQSRKKRLTGTSEWLFQTREFSQWIRNTESPLLWCYGKIGLGKTILMASVIDKLLTEKRHPDIFISFFFVRFDDRNSLTAEAILQSIIQQILNHTGLSQEIEYLLEKLQLASSSLEEVLSKLASVESTTKIFLASRDSVAREMQNKFPTHGRVSMKCSAAQSDIVTYFEHMVQDKWNLIEEIKLALREGADGTFLWVAFQIDELGLQHCDDDIRKAILNLPKSLEETFDRAVGRIVSRGEKSTATAQQVFRWVAVSKEPLSLDQLRELIFIGIGQQYSMPERHSNGIYNISSWYENLVYVDEELQTVQFAHQTVRQFFLEKASKARHNQFHLKLENADHHIGEICGSAAASAVESLASFQRSDTRETKERLQEGHDLMENVWGEATFNESSSFILNWSIKSHHYALIRLFFLAGKISITLRDQILENAAATGDITMLDFVLDILYEGEILGSEVIKACIAAIAGGRLDIVEQLLAAGANVNFAPAWYYGQTALQAAAKNGHRDII